jgi:PilZ domain
MSPHRGRLEKRMSLTVPLEFLRLQKQTYSERANTENVSTAGARILAKQPLESGECLEVRFLESNVRAESRVVYCQQASDGRFGVGVHFEKITAAWSQALKGTPRIS